MLILSLHGDPLFYKMNVYSQKTMGTLSASSINHTEDFPGNIKGEEDISSPRPRGSCHSQGSPIKCIQVKVVLNP